MTVSQHSTKLFRKISGVLVVYKYGFLLTTCTYKATTTAPVGLFTAYTELLCTCNIYTCKLNKFSWVRFPVHLHHQARSLLEVLDVSGDMSFLEMPPSLHFLYRGKEPCQNVLVARSMFICITLCKV